MKQPHIACNADDVASRVILPGDPARVDRIAHFLDDPEEKAYNREFKTITGRYRGVLVSVTSTGIGGASLAIALEELIACGAHTFIRTGSCGACRTGIELGDLVLSQAAVREDGASRMYMAAGYPAVADFGLLRDASAICKEENWTHHIGITRSHDSFYVDDEEARMNFWNAKHVLASDMETAALYVIASQRKVRALSILNNVVLYRSDVREGIGEYADGSIATTQGEEREILAALKTMTYSEAAH